MKKSTFSGLWICLLLLALSTQLAYSQCSVSISGVPASVLCSSQTATLTAVATGGSAPFTYSWSNWAAGPQITVAQSGVYIVTATDGTCSVKDTAIVYIADYVYTNSITASDPDMTGRLNRFGVVSTCAAPKVCPGTYTTTGIRDYDSYPVTNPDMVNPICVTVTLNPACSVGDYLFTAAYLSSFDPANLCTNYLADPGVSPTTTPVTYSFQIPAGETAIVVVHAVNVGTSCSGYTLYVDIPRPAPSITLSGTDCPGNLLAFVEPAGNTYLWNTGSVYQGIYPDTAGIYSVAVSYGNSSCVQTADSNIFLLPAPNVQISGGGIHCHGTYTLTASGASSYLWSGSETTDSIQTNSSGTYQVIGTGLNGCTAVATSQIIIGDYYYIDSITAADADMTGRLYRDGVPSTCASPKTCPTMFTPAGIRDYDSYTIVNQDIINPVCAIAYVISDCSGSNALFAVAYNGTYNPADLCQNYLADIGSSPIPTGRAFSFEIAAGGTATIIIHMVTDGESCSGYEFAVDLPRNATTINTTGTACSGALYAYASPTGAAYIWSHGPTTQGVTLTSNDNYTVTVNYGNHGCTGVADTLLNRIAPPGNATAIIGPDSVCQGETGVNYSVAVIPNAGIYDWTFPANVTGNDSVQSILADFGLTAASGNISVVGLNDCGAGNPSTIYVNVVPKPASPVISYNGTSIVSSVAMGNQWYRNSVLIPGETGQTFMPVTNGTYYSVVTVNGCSSDQSNLVDITTLSVDELTQKISIYPNPFNDQLTLIAEGINETVSWELTNTLGQILYSGTLTNRQVIATDQLARGVYNITLRQGSYTRTLKLVK